MTKESKHPYWLKLLIALDQAFNTITGGSPDETFSSRVGRRSFDGVLWARIAERIIDTIFFWQKNHCFNSIEKDEV